MAALAPEIPLAVVGGALFGVSAGTSRESRYASETAPPNATQIKLSDGLNPFDAGALAEGVTVQPYSPTELIERGKANNESG